MPPAQTTNHKTATTYTTLMSDLKENPQKYLDIAAVMILVISADKQVVYVNKKACEILGYDREEILGENWFMKFLPESIKNEVMDVFQKLVRGEIEPVEYYENPIITKQGEVRMIAWNNTVLRDKEGKIIGTISSGQDITEKKKEQKSVEEKAKKYAVLFKNAPLAYQSLDKEGKVLIVNESWERLFGYSKEDVIGKWFGDYIEKNETPKFKKDFQEYVEKGEISGVQYTVKRKDGSKVKIEINGKIGYDDQRKFKQTHCILFEI